MLELFITFFKIGAFTFGGGYVMLPLMEEFCVENKKWITHDEFMNTIVIAESTPGPIAVNLATYCGYRRFGLIGGCIATFGVVLPSLICIYIISLFFDNFLKNKFITNAFIGIRIAVALIIINVGINLLKTEIKENREKTLKELLPKIIIFIFSFIAMTLSSFLGLHISFIQIIIISIVSGVLLWFI